MEDVRVGAIREGVKAMEEMDRRQERGGGKEEREKRQVRYREKRMKVEGKGIERQETGV